MLLLSGVASPRWGIRRGAFVYPRRMRIGRRDVALTNLDKIFFPGPGLTKGDLVRYYVDLAPYTAGMWRRKVSLASRFDALGLEPPATLEA